MCKRLRILAIPSRLLDLDIDFGKDRTAMKYDEDTLRWLKDRTNANMLRRYVKNLSSLSRSARNELLAAGLISKDYSNNTLTLTEKGHTLLKNPDY